MGKDGEGIGVCHRAELYSGVAASASCAGRLDGLENHKFCAGSGPGSDRTDCRERGADVKPRRREATHLFGARRVPAQWRVIAGMTPRLRTADRENFLTDPRNGRFSGAARKC
ncbi:hypothetical protein GCM10023174_29520 [Chelativorans composti]